MNYKELLDKAEAQTKRVKTGCTFVLKELFMPTEWKKIEKGDRLSLGRSFKKLVLDNRIKGVEYIGKAENNSAMYIKK